jgi:hypothetical protein
MDEIDYDDMVDARLEILEVRIYELEKLVTEYHQFLLILAGRLNDTLL